MHEQWRQRRARIKKWLKPLPRRANIDRYPVLKWFATSAKRRPYLWSFKNAAVVRAIYIGSLLAFMPSYGVQILIALAAAIIGRANLTILVALQLITNPLTLGPIYVLTYTIGIWLEQQLRITPRSAVTDGALALILGGLVLGSICAVILHALWALGRYEARRFRINHHKHTQQHRNPSKV